MRQLRSDAQRLLAHRVRLEGLDPKLTRITDVVAVHDQAVLSWETSRAHGVMGLVRYLDRWWDALDAAPGQRCWTTVQTFPLDGSGLSSELISAATLHNADVQAGAIRAPCMEIDALAVAPASVLASGGMVREPRTMTAGYDLLLQYAANNAPRGTIFSRIYGRSPTKAEMVSNPAPPHGYGGPSDVFFFNVMLNNQRPVTFQDGTGVAIWFPFVLDDTLQYRLSFVSGGEFSRSIHAGSVFDNVVQFRLPPFMISPGGEFQAEVEGFW